MNDVKLNRPAKLFLLVISLVSVINAALTLYGRGVNKQQTEALCAVIYRQNPQAEVAFIFEDRRGEQRRVLLSEVCSP